MTEEELKARAYHIQNACNLRGVSRFLVEACDALGHLDSDSLEDHPAIIIIVDKMTSLCHIQWNKDKIFEAMRECGDVARREEENAANHV